MYNDQFVIETRIIRLNNGWSLHDWLYLKCNQFWLSFSNGEDCKYFIRSSICSFCPNLRVKFPIGQETVKIWFTSLKNRPSFKWPILFYIIDLRSLGGKYFKHTIFFFSLKGQLLSKLCEKYKVNWQDSLSVCRAQTLVVCPNHPCHCI